MFAQLLLIIALIVALLATVSEAWFGFVDPFWGLYGMGFGYPMFGYGGFGMWGR